MKKIIFILLIILTLGYIVYSKANDEAKKNVILIEAENFSGEENGSGKVMDGRPKTSGNKCLVSWNNKGHSIEWTFDVQSAGLYKMILRYAGGRNWNIYREIKIDNKIIPGAEKIKLMPTGGFGRDEKEWKDLVLADANNKTIIIKLEKGKHKLNITNLGGDGDDGAANFDTFLLLDKDYDLAKISLIYNFPKSASVALQQYNINDYNTPLETSKQIKIGIKSILLQKEMPVRIYLPKGYSNKTKYPVLYLFHGLGSDSDNWLLTLGLDKKIDEMINNKKINPMIVVCPNIDASFGINSSMEPKIVETQFNGNNVKISYGMYRDYICKELIPFVDANLSTRGIKEDRMIGGVSMGGFASLHIAFTYPELFSKAAGHSAVTILPDLFQSNEIMKTLYTDEKAIRNFNPQNLAENKILKDIQISIDCGEDDGLLLSNKLLYDTLKNRGANVTFFSGKGAHIASYWQSQFEKYLIFYSSK